MMRPSERGGGGGATTGTGSDFGGGIDSVVPAADMTGAGAFVSTAYQSRAIFFKYETKPFLKEILIPLQRRSW